MLLKSHFQIKCTVNIAYNELGYNGTSAIVNIFSSPDLPKCIKSPSVITNCGYKEHLPQIPRCSLSPKFTVVKILPIWSLSMNLISDSKSFISTAPGTVPHDAYASGLTSDAPVIELKCATKKHIHVLSQCYRQGYINTQPAK